MFAQLPDDGLQKRLRRRVMYRWTYSPSSAASDSREAFRLSGTVGKRASFACANRSIGLLSFARQAALFGRHQARRRRQCPPLTRGAG